MEDLNTVITKFMQAQYSINPNQKSLDIIVDAGFKPFEYPAKQFANLNTV